MHLTCLSVIWLATTLTAITDAASILAYLPFSAKSHYIVFNPILKALAERGHHITVYKTIATDDPPKTNYKEILLPNYLEDLKKILNFNVVGWGKSGFISQLMGLNEMGLLVCEDSFKSPLFKKLLQSNDKYDLLITESLFSQSSIAALAHRFNAHHVVLMPLGNSHWTNFVTSNPYSPSYIPDYNSLSPSDMNLLERIHNTFVSAVTILLNQFYYMPKFQAQVDKHFDYPGKENRPPLGQILSNVSLVIENSHMSMNGAEPKAPNILQVGGLNIKKNKPLPADLKLWLDSSKQGCIYFSYGTVVEGGHLEDKVKNAYISAFSKIKQRVIWKIDKLEGKLAQNILTGPWMPQQDILAHPNVVLFITHGGYLSINEAVNYGVPLVGTPFFGDQAKNLKEVVKSGIGVRLEYDNITEESVLWAINEVTGNKRYKETAVKKSAIYRDRQVSALDSAVYWVEYVIKHKGAYHLRPHSSLMAWYQSELIDVAAVALFTLILVLLMFRRLYHFLTCQTCGKKTSKKDKRS